MNNTQSILQNIIDDFSPKKFTRFFREISGGNFRELNEDIHGYKDDFFSEGLTLGEIDCTDAKICVSTFKTNKALSERSGKKAQYEKAKKYLRDNANYNAGIFIFYDKEGNFRFSLIFDIPLPNGKRDWSSFRRFTYFISIHKPNKTFRLQIGRADFSEFRTIQKAFSIDAVTDEFYKSFKPNFDKLAENVEGTGKKDLKQNFALLFIIRIIFLGFVQKKGWLNNDEEFLINFWKEYKEKYYGKNLFYEEWLNPLFFNALNSPPGKKVFNRSTPFSKNTAEILQMAPFLNGELFKEKRGVDNQELTMPDKIIEEFFEFLFSYNFTIEENTLYDQELELNPEFLGIIFERLVNKEGGAVYTPRVEVDFMCRISLVKWFEKNTDIPKKKLYHLFFDKGFSETRIDLLTKEEREIVITNLNNITVCDPAAGSGAFLVGMMQVLDEIFAVLSTETTEDAFERKKEIISRSLYGVEVKEWAVWINQLRLWLSLFIEMPDELSKSFLPLLPNLEFKVRRGDSIVQVIGKKIFPVESHANISSQLKTKITNLRKEKSAFFYGKGLINAKFIRKRENELFLAIIEEQIADKKRTLNLFGNNGENVDIFGEITYSEKQRLQIDEKRKEQLLNELKELEEEKRSFRDEHPLVWNIEFAEIFYDKKGFDIIIGNPPYVPKEEISDPNKRKTNSDYKMLLRNSIYEEYPDYFYTSEQKNKVRYKIDGQSDLYTFFYLKSLKLIAKKGILTFICSNSWLDVGYGKWMQQFILDNVPLHYVVDNQAKRSFASADVNTVITVFDSLQKNIPGNFKTRFVMFRRAYEEILNTENLLLNDYMETITKDEDFRVYPIDYEGLKEAGMIYETEEDKKLGKGTYVGDKWGGKYLRAPDIYFEALLKGDDKLIKIGEIAKVEGYIHDNNTGINFPENWFIKSVKDTETIVLTKSSVGVKKYGVKNEGNSQTIADLLFPRTFGDRHLVLINIDEIFGKEFYKIIVADKYNIGIQMNLTFAILQRELIGLTNLGGGAIKFSASDVKLFLVLPSIKLKKYEKFVSRQQMTILEEFGLDKTKPIRKQKPKPLPDRKALDDIVFNALGLTEAEREEVYLATAELVQNRLNKARSV